jgi:uncharacterized protein (DUF924 family)
MGLRQANVTRGPALDGSDNDSKWTVAPVPERPQTVLAFWREAGSDKWFARDEAFDASIRTRFAALQAAAARGELDDWQATPEGALSLIILLDQFPRNLFRGSPLAFATDAKARSIAREALARGFDRQVENELMLFLYMPFAHSEDLPDQMHCLALIEALGWEEATSSAREHRDIIARFGHFPHRNAVLGRDSTEEEQRFLDEGGFSG